MDGSVGKIIFEIIHKQRDETLFWHLDGKYIGQTHLIHQQRLSPSIGYHKLTITDSKANILIKKFNIVGKKHNSNN